jgi:general secretion pathway protein N
VRSAALMRKRAVGGCKLVVLALSTVMFTHTQGIASAANEPADSTTLSNTLNLHAPDRPLGLSTFDGRAEPAAGNPLWAVPLRVLTATSERPLFSPSRRPPPAAVAAVPSAAAVRAPARPAAPDHPLLTLLGTVIGTSEGIGVFVDQQNKTVIQLKDGQEHDGWTLQSVHERDVVFADGKRAAVLALPARSDADRPENAALVSAAAPSGTWMDGDGQMISPPVSPKYGQANSRALPAATWTDGDGRVISPPQKN